MTHFKMASTTARAQVTIDDRFHLVIRRNAPPPMASAQLVVNVYPIADGEVWCEPYEVFVVDEGRIVELENEARRQL